ncbi:MAG: TIGR03087 family PEP-CTERM/XrtA system glycosyltransferase [Gammaproteobacteria bacterium]|nr:TIGR03087 family PEP-CTERM/XrtA system glycosyltransferase [Gammaproteobacteria bacterium]
MLDLLLLVHRIPYPPDKGDKIRSYHLLKHLASQYRVHLGTFIDDVDDWRHVDTVKALCAETCFVKLQPTRARILSMRGFLSGKPLTLTYYRSAELQRWVRKTMAAHSIQRVVAFSSAMAQFADEFTGVRRVMDFVDVDSDKWAQYAKSKPWPLSWVYRRESETLLSYERSVAARWDASVLVSNDEAELFQRLAPQSAARVCGISNGVDSDYFSPELRYENPYPAGGPVLVFTGAMDYWANVDAVVWFAHEVLPRIQSQIKDARFYIVGSRPSADVLALRQCAGVSVTGTVPDVRPYVHYAVAAVAPLRIARGIQNKVLEALSMARPVIATSAAAEGLKSRPEDALWVADAAQDYAQRCVAMLRGEIAPQAGASGRRCVVEHYSWAGNLTRFLELLEPAR